MGAGISVGRWCRHWEGGSVGRGLADGECMEDGSMVQREGASLRGEWCTETRVVQWEREAVGYVVIFLFHPPN